MGTNFRVQRRSIGLLISTMTILATCSTNTRSVVKAATSSASFPVTSATLKNKAGTNVEPGMRPARYNGANPDGWWCIQNSNCAVDPNNPYQAQGPQSMIDREMQLASQLGVGVLRVEFDWPLIETAGGVYDWSRADYIVNEAIKYGIQLQPVLVYTPSWAGPSPTSSPTSSQSWTSFVTQVVTRYENSVHYWELWNEPDGGGYWSDGPQKYVQNILVPGYHAIKSVDSSARVLLGAPYYVDTAFLNDIYTYGGGNAFDITGFHEYTNVLSQSGIQGDVNTVQGVLDSHGQGSKPIWIGEYGYNEGSNSTNDTDHLTAMQIMLQHVTGYQVASWYNLRDDYSMSCCPPTVVKAAYWGLVQHDDVTLKQGFSSMQSLIAGFSGPVTPSPTAPVSPTATASVPTSTATLPPPSPTLTATTVLSPTTTTTDTATPSPTASAIPTSTPTLTPTNTPVPTSIPSPTAAVTATPSSLGGPLLFSDDFESDPIGSVPAGWSVSGVNAGFSVQQNGSHVYDHNGWTAISTAGSSSWTDYTYTIRMLPNNWQSEADGVLFRVQDSQNYYRVLYTDGTTLSLARVIGGTTTQLATSHVTMSGGSWHTIQVSASGNQLSVAVDGVLKLAATDGTFATGAVGVAANSPVQFDSATVTAAGTLSPTASATDTATTFPTASAIPTSIPTLTPTDTPIPTNPPSPTPLPTVTATAAQR